MNRRLARIEVGLRELAAPRTHDEQARRLAIMDHMRKDPEIPPLMRRVADNYQFAARAERAGLDWVRWDGLTAEERERVERCWREAERAVRDPTGPTRVLVDQ